jgi:hypothetical protein
MHNRFDLQQLWRPRLTLRALDAAGRLQWQQTATNTATYAFADMLMTAWLRSGPSSVTYLYARFGDSGANPGVLAPTGQDLRNTTRTNFVAAPGDSLVLGGLWVPLLAAPSQASSDLDHYAANSTTFYFRIPASLSTAQIDPAANFDVATSYIYALGLAISPNTSDRSQDVIVTATEDFDPFLIPTGGQMAVDYAGSFELQS